MFLVFKEGENVLLEATILMLLTEIPKKMAAQDVCFYWAYLSKKYEEVKLVSCCLSEGEDKRIKDDMYSDRHLERNTRVSCVG